MIGLDMFPSDDERGSSDIHIGGVVLVAKKERAVTGVRGSPREFSLS